MHRNKRLRRVVLLMASFARNRAYITAFGPPQDRIPKDASHDFWATVTGNFVDAAVLDWCKLFADKNDKHNWSNIVTRAPAFESAMLHQLGQPTGQFDVYVKSMRRYRDKFVAHLDSDDVMDIPLLDLAEAAIRFYHGHIVSNEVDDAGKVFHGLLTTPSALAAYYTEQARVARIFFNQALPPA